MVVTDEVYEHLVFPGATHVPIATLPGMAERTLTISSGGKTFNTTGWKIGWICGPPALVTAARTAKQFLTYVNGAPFQPAIAVGLDLGDDFYDALAADLTAKRDHLVAGLEAAGFTTYRPEATYFTTVDIRPVDPDGDGMAFCRTLPERCGVVARAERGVLRPARARPPPRAIRLLQAPRRPRRGRPPHEGARVVSVLRIAGLQHDIVWKDRDANFEHLAPMIAAAAGAGAGLVLCTETFSTGFAVDDPDLGEPEGGPSSTFLADQAVEHGVWVGGSCPEIPPMRPATTAARTTASCWPVPTARCTGTARCTRSRSPARTRTSAPAPTS